jgi:hypothetical protein
MAKQIHQRLTDEHVRTLLELYQHQAISLFDVLQRLGCGRSRFFELFKRYRQDPYGFTIVYPRRSAQHRLSAAIDAVIKEELEKDHALIRNPDTPVCNYNYAYIRDQVVRRTGQKISAQSIRNRAKAWGYYIYKRKKDKKIPREVVTQAAGMLLQHDTSHHKWAPYADQQWSLITTIEDHSRYLLYADLVEQESTWRHIQAAQSVILKYGVGLYYYVDRHSIFHYQRSHDTPWRIRRAQEAALTHWRIVIEKCNMRVIYALSASAKGKVERPYRWLQDRIVRSCARERIRTIDDARTIMRQEIQRYNEHQVHSTTGEIPAVRLNRAIAEGRNCFKPFQLPPNYSSRKDIFCLHEYRKVNGYNQISWETQSIKVPTPLPRGTTIELHIIPHPHQTEVRLWYLNRVLKVIYYKNNGRF